MKSLKRERKYSKKEKIKFLFVSLILLSILTFVLIEGILSLMDYPNSYDLAKKYNESQEAKWWSCDSISGPRFVKNQANGEDSLKYLDPITYSRLKIVNNEGYHDVDEFIDIPLEDKSLKFLMIGDSFTWGQSADIDSSYVEIFENLIKKKYKSIIWNAGIPGVGTNYALFATKKLLPKQKTDYVILGFFMNDFYENIVPFDRNIFLKTGTMIRNYDLDDSINPIPISTEDMCKMITGSYPIEGLNFFQRVSAKSRLLTFIKKGMIRVKNKLNDKTNLRKKKELEKTRRILEQLDEYVKSHNAQLIVMLIPYKSYLVDKPQKYKSALNILKELGIDYVEVINELSIQDYRKDPDCHWNNKGHKIAAEILFNHFMTKYNCNIELKK